MKDDMRWEQKSMNENLHTTGPKSGSDGGGGILKAGLVIVAGLIIAALARGVKKTEDLDSYSEEIDPDEYDNEG